MKQLSLLSIKERLGTSIFTQHAAQRPATALQHFYL